MLSSEMLLLLLTGGVVGGVVGFLGAIPYLKKKGINIDNDIDIANNIVTAAEPVINVADALLPNNPAVGILKTIEKWAKIAAGDAEQLKHAGDINGDQRADAAEKVVNAVLKELNVEVTDNRKILIDAAIKDTVGSFGHKDKTEAEKEAEKQALQAQVSQLTLERDNLKNTIDTITTAASTVQVATQAASNTVQTA